MEERPEAEREDLVQTNEQVQCFAFGNTCPCKEPCFTCGMAMNIVSIGE